MPKNIAIAGSRGVAGLEQAVQHAGATVSEVDIADAVIWRGGSPAELGQLLSDHPGIEWVHLPGAGIEAYTVLLTDERTWTCAKGAYGQVVAEQALALLLAIRRGLAVQARTSKWFPHRHMTPLSGSPVTILGAGGIAVSMAELLQPFGCEITVVRRDATKGFPVAGVEILDITDLHQALTTAESLVIALALTPETRGIIGAKELAVLPAGAFVVNVARGGVIDTDALVESLTSGHLGGAGLDVTDPEPLPDSHPLWNLSNCLISSHSANPVVSHDAELARMVTENVRRYVSGEPLLGMVDPSAGY